MRKIELTPEEADVLTNLTEKANELGVTIRVAGGWVRDKLLGLPSHDIDIAVEGMSGAEFAKHCTGNVSILEARPEQSKHLETAMAHIKGFDIDFAGLRKETYAESRIPTVETGTPEEDARRRDLTANAMFYNPHTDEIEDYVGGYNDLGNAMAITPLDPKQTFLDDPLRILRCIRFCARFEWDPSIGVIEAANDPEVQQAFKDKISKERIFSEVIGQAEGDGWKAGFLTGPEPSYAMALVLEFGFMDVLFSPEGVELNPWDTDQNSKFHDLSILHHTLKAFAHFNQMNEHMIPQDIAIVNLALICHDLGKRDVNCRQLKDDGTFSYLTHDDRSVELADIVLDQLACPKGMKDRVLKLVQHHMRFHALEDSPSKKALRKILRDLGDDWYLLLKHSSADSCGKTSVDVGEMTSRHGVFSTMMREVLDEQDGDTKVKRPCSGHDLAEWGVKKGPAMGIIFKALDEALLEHPEMTKEEAQLFVCHNFGEHIDKEIHMGGKDTDE